MKNKKEAIENLNKLIKIRKKKLQLEQLIIMLDDLFNEEKITTIDKTNE